MILEPEWLDLAEAAKVVAGLLDELNIVFWNEGAEYEGLRSV